MRRGWLAALAVVAALAACDAASSAPESTSAVSVSDASESTSVQSPASSGAATTTRAPAARPRAPSGDSVELIEHDGDERRYLLHVPPDLRAGASVPLVLVLHGAGGRPEDIAIGSGWNAMADERGMVVAYPEGEDESWNAGACCGIAVTDDHDDVGFLEALIEHLSGFAQVDPERVIVVGHSNGGMMAYRLACDPDSGLFGAASVAGTNMAGCQPARPLSFMEIHGTADRVVPYEGASTSESEAVGLPPFSPFVVSLDWMADALGCDATPDEVTVSKTTTSTWTGCDDDVAAQLVTLVGAGHTWPSSRSFDATTAIADFFFPAVGSNTTETTDE